MRPGDGSSSRIHNRSADAPSRHLFRFLLRLFVRLVASSPKLESTTKAQSRRTRRTAPAQASTRARFRTQICRFRISSQDSRLLVYTDLAFFLQPSNFDCFHPVQVVQRVATGCTFSLPQCTKNVRKYEGHMKKLLLRLLLVILLGQISLAYAGDTPGNAAKSISSFSNTPTAAHSPARSWFRPRQDHFQKWLWPGQSR